MNATTLGTEDGYPNRHPLADEHTSWDVSLPDKVQYGVPIVNISRQFGSVSEKIFRAADLDITEIEVAAISRMSNTDVASHYGQEFADRYSRLRCPFGRTGLNGVGIFYEAGPSQTSDMVLVHASEPDQMKVALVFNRGRWNTPGGFREISDRDALSTAVRELQEETGLDLDNNDSSIIQVVSETKASDRTTDNAWLENQVFATTVEILPTLMANDDAERAEWHPVNVLQSFVENKILSKAKLDYIQKSITALGLN